MPGENARDTGLSAEEEITRIMKGVIDRLKQEMQTRFTRLDDLNSKFGFIFRRCKFVTWLTIGCFTLKLSKVGRIL